MSKRKCLCGYESRIDNVKNHMKKCKAYPIIKVFKEQLEKLQDKVDYLQKRNEEVEKKSDPKILEKLNEVTNLLFGSLAGMICSVQSANSNSSFIRR